jgi:hypothetical protein
VDLARVLVIADSTRRLAPVGRFDELIVSTLPGSRSRWMALDLPRHARSIAGVALTHVETVPAAAGG